MMDIIFECSSCGWKENVPLDEFEIYRGKLKAFDIPNGLLCKECFGMLKYYMLEPDYIKELKERDEPYQFQAGDVAKATKGKYRGGLRIFLRKFDGGGLSIMDDIGQQQCSTEDEQEWAECCGYVKIGVLSDFLPKGDK